MIVLDVAKTLLERHPLCDHCLGRQFALLGHGLSNRERGTSIKLLLTIEGHRLAASGDEAGTKLLKTLATNGQTAVAAQTLKSTGVEVDKETPPCYLCEGRFNNLPETTKRIVDRLREYEYQTFLIGTRIFVQVEEREDELRAMFDVKWGESIRSEFSREIGKHLADITQRAADFKRPDILVIVDPFTNRIALEVNPIFIAGRYRKLVTGIPQAKWICRECQGRGCPRCEGTGKMYQESVEELIATPTLSMTSGTDVKFHAAGREDVDAKVLGHGRPFIIEVKRPKVRSIDLKRLEHEINEFAAGKVEVERLGFSSKENVRKIKGLDQAEKVYRAAVLFEQEPTDERLTAIERTLSGTSVRQQTPLRVLHRRADRVREKHIYELRVRRLGPNLVEIMVRCQGGLYIKELITGDDGRTTPSVASISNIPARCVELEVMEVVVDGA